MASLKLIASFAGLLFFITSFHVTQSINPLSTDKVLGYFSSLDTKFRAVDFWKKILVGVVDDNPSNSEILEEIKLVAVQIKELGIQLDQKIDKSVMLTAERIRAYAQVDSGIRDVITRIDNIDFMYDEYFSKIVNEQYDAVFLPEYVNKMLKGEEGPKFEIYKMNRLFYPNRTGNIEQSLFDHIHDQVTLINRERCDEKFSPQHWLFNIYVNVIVTEVKAYLMTIIAYSIDQEINNVSRSLSMSTFTQEFGDRVNNHLSSFREQLSRTPRYIRRCDPENHQQGTTFIELERLMQLFLLREDQFPNRRPCRYCRNHPEQDGAYLLEEPRDQYLAQGTKCKGTIFRCGQYIQQFIRDGYVCVLPSDNKKRYQWLTYNDGNGYPVLGDDSSCPGQKCDYKRHEYNWWSHELEVCTYCACACAEKDHTRTIRSFSIRPQLSTFRSNMVVTGVRIVEQNKMVHIQIKEGRLMPGGRIDPNSEAWIPLEKMDFATKKIEVIEFNKKETRGMNEGEDYVNFNQYGYRMVLEDLIAPKGSVVVGVRFTGMDVRSKNFLGVGLDIMTAAFNWTTGKILEEGKWVHPVSIRKLVEQGQNSQNTQRAYNLNIPTKSKVNLPSGENMVLVFDIANPKEDVGQTVVPFLDSMPIAGNPPMPLGGIGLIYKTAPSFGGFISPRIHHIDLANYMDHNNFNHYF